MFRKMFKKLLHRWPFTGKEPEQKTNKQIDLGPYRTAEVMTLDIPRFTTITGNSLEEVQRKELYHLRDENKILQDMVDHLKQSVINHIKNTDKECWRQGMKDGAAVIESKRITFSTYSKEWKEMITLLNDLADNPEKSELPLLPISPGMVRRINNDFVSDSLPRPTRLPGSGQVRK